MDYKTDHTALADEDIALLIQRGDTEKFGILMDRYGDKLTRYGRKFLARKENIEDIVQDVFIKAYQNIQDFDSSLKFSSWIYRISHNAFVNGLRNQQRFHVPDFDFDTLVSHSTGSDDPPLDEKGQKELRAMIDQGLEELKPKYREAIILHFLEELSYKEISDVLKVPVGTVGVRVLRGKRQLWEVYEKMNIHDKR